MKCCKFCSGEGRYRNAIRNCKLILSIQLFSIYYNNYNSRFVTKAVGYNNYIDSLARPTMIMVVEMVLVALQWKQMEMLESAELRLKMLIFLVQG